MKPESTPPADRIIILCDFDGTITPADTSNFLYTRFAGAGTYYADLWERGEIGTPEELRLTFATIRASREAMEAALKTIPLDPVFPSFYRYCRQVGIKTAIVSDGLEWWIRVILSHHGLDEIPVYANVIQFTADGFRFSHPWFDPEYPRQGTSKRTIVRDFQNGGWRVFYIGDGKSDFTAARQADRVFAKSTLLAYCQKSGIAHIPFEGFADLLYYFQKEVVFFRFSNRSV